MIGAGLIDEFITRAQEAEHGTDGLGSLEAGQNAVMKFDADLMHREAVGKDMVEDFIFAPFDIELEQINLRVPVLFHERHQIQARHLHGAGIAGKPGIAGGVEWGIHPDFAVATGEGDGLEMKLGDLVFRPVHGFDAGGRRIDHDDVAPELLNQSMLEGDIATQARAVNHAARVQAQRADGPATDRIGAAQFLERVTSIENEPIKEPVTKIS